MVPRRKTKKQAEEIRNEAAEDLEREPGGEALEEGNAGQPVAAVEEEEAAALTAEQVIEALASELEEFEDRHLRLVAEFDNFRKRTVRERGQQAQRAQGELIKSLLESLDDLARVSELGTSDHDAAAILEGVQLVELKLRRALEQAGLRPIEAVGQPFNPELHEAMITVTTDQPEEDDVVSQELAKGYLFKDTLLRPSLVGVKKYRPEAAGAGDDSNEIEDGS